MQSALLSLLLALVLTAMGGERAVAAPATFAVSRLPAATSTPITNAYLAGRSVVSTAPVGGDLAAMGGSIVAAGNVKGDALLLGGAINTRGTIAGDLRALGGTIAVDTSVGGDAVLLGYRVDSVAHAGGSTFAIGANVSLAGGAAGPTTIYANNVYLAGDFVGEVRVVAGGVVTLGPDARIHGNFIYESPEPAHVADSAVISGEVRYTNASYLPDAGTSRALAVASIGLFLLIRIIGALILAGLLAGLFPRLAEAVVARATKGSTRSVLLLALLGGAAMVATPILLLILALTFVGMGIAVMGMISYILLVLLAFVYAGILLGALFSRRFLGRDTVAWHDGVLGMLALSLLALVPVIGWFVVFLSAAFAAGVLLSLFFHAAFPGDDA